ncbi:VLRF1 family aeRF1-type release factor [Virgibacillus halodenitrificans]|uniref:VLRF1 family aeRF1-type release factor n=1 Tax=Virgibacillus halodenitrificans TaxID=1482 RepID=UPI0024C091A4|nr:VLRF1 family aeRF1-type release factor [Virgibacillus halodenitrificans]WHX26835.1 VLRF1 family aeRF1-type release factor [Virgibacillus halodenitrificans]
MDLTKEIKELENIRRSDSNKVFTMYLNTDPSDPEQQGGEWKIHYKNGMRNFESYLKEDEDKEELKNFQLVKQKVDKFIKGKEQKFLRGVVIIATADEEVWFADRVQMRLKTEFFWQETPELGQIKKLEESYPKTGIVLVQQNEVKVIESYLNEIEEIYSYELNVDTDNWRQKVGPRKANASSMAPGATNAQKDNFAARYEANKQRWYKKIAPKLDKAAKDKEWEKIVIVGESDPSQELKQQMNKQVDEVIQKNMLDHEESKVLAEVFG